MINFLESFVNDYFYQDIENYKINPNDYLHTVRDTLNEDWIINKRNVFIECYRKNKKNNLVQGWKIHLSTDGKNERAILTEVCKIANKFKFEFKFIADKTLYNLTTEKPYPRSQSGKFVTIYTNSETEFQIIIDLLYEKFKKFEGMYILSDKRYKDCKILYYRYGAYSAIIDPELPGTSKLNLLNLSGNLIEDERKPFYVQPDFIKLPPYLNNDHKKEDSKLFQKYKIVEPIKLTNSGGVYRAVSRLAKKEVIIKESRPYTCLSKDGSIDSIARRKKETEFLRSLEDIKIGPRFIESFYDWEHYFIVVEYIDGLTMRNFIKEETPFVYPLKKSNNQILHDYLTKVCKIMISLLDKVEKIHARNIIIADISLDNIMVTPELNAVIIDLESTFDNKTEKKDIMSTIQNKNIENNFFYLDYYAIGIIFSEFFIQRSEVRGLDDDIILKSVKDVCEDFQLPIEFYSIIEGFIKCEAMNLISIRKTIKKLEKLLLSLNFSKLSIEKKYFFESEEDFENKCLSTIEEQDKNISFFLNNPNHSIKPFTPLINNDINLGYGKTGLLYYKYVNGEKNYDIFENWLIVDIFNRNEQYSLGLLDGLSGVALTLLLGNKKDAAVKILRLISRKEDLFYKKNISQGISGYGLTLIKFWEVLNEKVYLKKAEDVAIVLMNTSSKNVKEEICWIEDSDNKVGLFYGNSGIALFFLYLYLATKKDEYLEFGKKIFSVDLNKKKLIRGTAGFPDDYSEGAIIRPYLSQGTAGVLSVAIRFYEVTKEVEYKNIIDEVLPDILIKHAPFPGLYNGISGLAYVFLDMYEVTKKPEYKNNAKRIISNILLFETELQEKKYFPGEGLQRFSLDLGGGSAGINLLLNKYLGKNRNTLFVWDSLIGGHRSEVF